MRSFWYSIGKHDQFHNSAYQCPRSTTSTCVRHARIVSTIKLVWTNCDLGQLRWLDVIKPTRWCTFRRKTPLNAQLLAMECACAGRDYERAGVDSPHWNIWNWNDWGLGSWTFCNTGPGALVRVHTWTWMSVPKFDTLIVWPVGDSVGCSNIRSHVTFST